MKEALINELREIAERNKHSEDREVKAAAGVLFSLLGALQSGRTMRLLAHMAPFSESEVRWLSASRN